MRVWGVCEALAFTSCKGIAGILATSVIISCVICDKGVLLGIQRLQSEAQAAQGLWTAAVVVDSLL